MQATRKLVIVDPRMLENAAPTRSEFGSPEIANRSATLLSSIAQPAATALTRLDDEMKQIMDNKMFGEDEKVKLYNNVLQKFMLTKTQALRERVVPVKWTETNIQQQQQQEQSPGWSGELSREEVEITTHDIVRSLPQKFRNKGAALMDRINRSSALGYNRRGELVYNGQTIPGTHISDLVNDAIRRRKHFNPTGWQMVAKALQELNFPKDLIGHKQRGEYMESLGKNEQRDITAAAAAVPARSAGGEAY